MRKAARFALSVLFVIPVVLEAAGKGQGGCVIRDEAAVYDGSKGDKIDKVLGKLKLHQCVVGITTRGILGNEFVFERNDGRVHIAAFAEKVEKGMYRTAWMDPADLSLFTFECGCGSSKKSREECTPFQGVINYEWNPCFLEARDKKQSELKAQGAGPGATPQAGAAGSRGEKALGNDDILSLVKVGLDDSLIISKINQAPAVAFDLSTEGIVALKTAKVSNGVIDSMMKRAEKK